MYVRSFADGNGDGTGDIPGLRSRLGYLADLGVDAVWVNPWYPSPLNDGGYDVADYRDIDPRFGTIEDAKGLIEDASSAGLRVLVDFVPNHTSSEHAWFREAVASAPGSAARDRYHFTSGRGLRGEQPPNNWTSVFGGPAWTRVSDGQWYLHMFDVTQPDLNWDNEEVREEFIDILKFWLDMGAAGFRVDVAHALVKEEGYPDALGGTELLGSPDGYHPHWDQPGIHEIVREWRSVVDEYPGSVMVAEAWLPSWDRLREYVRPDEYHQTFDFHFLKAPWSAEAVRSAIDESLDACGSVGSVPTWVLSNHDVIRQVTRFGLDSGIDERAWLSGGGGAGFDLERGLRRARAAALLMLALPGSVYLYQGEELGLPEVADLPEGALQDPVWERSGHTDKGRDGCRVPLPWARDGESFGFGEDGAWLPQPEWWGEFSVEAQTDDPDSMLELYRAALALRGKSLGDDESIGWLDMGPGVVAFTRDDAFTCVVNYGPDSVALPKGDVILATTRLSDESLPAEAAAWVATAG